MCLDYLHSYCSYFSRKKAGQESHFFGSTEVVLIIEGTFVCIFFLLSCEDYE